MSCSVDDNAVGEGGWYIIIMCKLDVGCGWREEGFLKNIAACIQHES